MKLAIAITHKGERRIQRLDLGRDEAGRATAKIGRAWDNDVLLDDKFVNPEHAELIVEEDRLLLRDLDSRNGTQVAGKSLKNSSSELKFGQTIALGDTQLQVFDTRAAVAPTSLRTYWYLLLERFGSISYLVGFSALFLLLDTLGSWLSSQEEFGLADAAISLGSSFMGLVMATLLMALLSKLLRNEFNLKAHWLITSMVFIAFVVFDFALQIVQFNIQSPDLSEWIRTIVMSTIVIVYLVGFMSYATYLSSGKRFVWALSMVVLAIAYSWSEEWDAEDHERWTSFSTSETLTLPPALLFRSTQSVNDYFDESDELFEFSSSDLQVDEP